MGHPLVEFTKSNGVFHNLFFGDTHSIEVVSDEAELLVLLVLVFFGSERPVSTESSKESLFVDWVYQLTSSFPTQFVGVSLTNDILRMELEEIDQTLEDTLILNDVKSFELLATLKPLLWDERSEWWDIFWINSISID